MNEMTMSMMTDELRNQIEEGKPYVMIVGGREHNVIVERIRFAYISGKVGINKVAMLISRPGRGETIVKVVHPQDERSSVWPGDELLHSEPCVVASSKGIHMKIDSVEIFEEPWRPYLPATAFKEDGSVDTDVLCKSIPAFDEYRVEGKGLVGSPAAWAPASETKKHIQLRVADEDSSSGQ